MASQDKEANKKSDEQFEQNKQDYQGTKENTQSASENLNRTVEALRKAQQRQDNIDKLANQNLGQSGYLKSLQMGKQGASQVAADAGNQAANAMVSTGLSRGMAADQAGAVASNAYSQAVQGQQTAAAQQLGNQINALQGNIASDVSHLGASNSAQGTRTQAQGLQTSTGQSMYDLSRKDEMKKWTDAKTKMDVIMGELAPLLAAFGSLLSDKNTKDFKKLKIKEAEKDDK